MPLKNTYSLWHNISHNLCYLENVCQVSKACILEQVPVYDQIKAADTWLKIVK